MIYKVLALTGLRKGELTSITIAQLWLDEEQPFIELSAKDEKSGRGAQIPLRKYLAAMRHSSLHLTMNISTDPTLLDVAGTINALHGFDPEPELSANANA